MNSFGLQNFPQDIILKIYDFLDSPSQVPFGSTCRIFRIIYNYDKDHQKIFKFIFENYEILSCPSRNMEKMFRGIYLVGCGEAHVYDDHRFLNATLIHLLWTNKHKLLCEGEGKESSQLKYVAKEISATSESWDIENDSEMQNHVDDLFRFHMQIVAFVRIMLTFLREDNEGSQTHVKFLEFVKNGCSSFADAFVKEFNCIDEVKKLEEKEKEYNKMYEDLLEEEKKGESWNMFDIFFENKEKNLREMKFLFQTINLK